MGGVLGGVGGGIAAAWQGNNPLTNAPRSGADAGKILPNWGKRWTKTGKGWMLSGVHGSGHSNQFPDAILPDGKTHIGGQYSFDAETLEGAVKSNYNRFVSKIPANSKASSSFQLLDNGNYLFQATSPGKVPGSSALYQKWVNAQGETFKMLKTTFAPDGSIIHIKPK